jgi:hypothetical protein
MPETLQLSNPAPLTTLSEDEILFRDNVRRFAEDKIRPLARASRFPSNMAERAANFLRQS